MDLRLKKAKWGDSGTRVRTSASNWGDPIKWDRWARDGVCLYCSGRGFNATKGKGEKPDKLEHCDFCDGRGYVDPYRARVFCASLADVFEDRRDLDPIRLDLFALIDQCQNLDWLLLTKRPECVARLMPEYHPCGRPGCEVLHVRPNVWLGTSVENQAYADERIPHLLRVPAAVRFLSVEPLLGPITIHALLNHVRGGMTGDGRCCCCGESIRSTAAAFHFANCPRQKSLIDWVIVGGESGPNARPCDIAWIRDIRNQCKDAGVACFVKQLGAACRLGEAEFPLSDPKGGDQSEWPMDLLIRQLPEVAR